MIYSYAAFFILNEDRSKTDGYIKKVTFKIPKVEQGEVMYDESKEQVVVS